MIDIKALQCWVTLVQNHSFSVTAEKLALSQPSISKIIHALENDLNVALLQKGENGRKRQVLPTEIGKRVYEYSLQILNQVSLLKQEVEDYRELKLGTLRIGMSLLGSRLLTPAFFNFHQQCPDIELAFIEAGTRDIEAALLDNRLDVGQLLLPVSNEFDYIPLCDYPMMVLFPRKRLAKIPASMSLRSLRDESFILFSRGFVLFERVVNGCRDQGFEPNVVCCTSQWELLRDMVAKEMGIALLPSYYTDEFDDKIFAAVPLTDPAINWSLSMAWPRHKKLTPAVKAWLKVIREEFSK
ncbi:LysR substrate-binding domain-containing protein [Snodgrassella alvi]|uniref:LysR substrate-binding domain-containing protein n=1 Tax=Snodgrassella alvi TaxID=1196083 RepID=UPI0035199A2B